MKILIINTDATYNRGDRAILTGAIKLIKDTVPQAEIWALSENPKKDEAWLGVNFLKIPVQSLSPFKLWKLVRFARTCDAVYWGGGEMLKDYTNKLGLWYWVTKMHLVWRANSNLYGFYQGIGPTKSESSKKLIAWCVNHTRAFLVRDKESKERLIEWGATVPVVDSYDPAIISHSTAIDPVTLRKLEDTYDISEEFIQNSFGFGARNWFHYKHGGLIPYKYKKLFMPAQPESTDSTALHDNLAKLADYIVEKHDLNITFFPMHLEKSEGDVKMARRIISQMKYGHRARVIDCDMLNSTEVIRAMSLCRGFIGVRLHSAIMATVANTPSMVLYYVDKGRKYFEQIGMNEYNYPIEACIDPNKQTELRQKIDKLLKDSPKIKKRLQKSLDGMQQKVCDDFQKHLLKND